MLRDVSGIRRKRSLRTMHHPEPRSHRVRRTYRTSDSGSVAALRTHHVPHVNGYILSFSGRFRLYQQLVISRADPGGLGRAPACSIAARMSLSTSFSEHDLAGESLRRLGSRSRDRGVRRGTQSYPSDPRRAHPLGAADRAHRVAVPCRSLPSADSRTEPSEIRMGNGLEATRVSKSAQRVR